MSHYRLREYEKCVSSANAYLAAMPAQDETLTEIRTALSDAKEQVRLAEAARQKKLAAEKEAQRKQAALEKEAATEWEKLKTSDNRTALQTFADKYAGTPQGKLAKQRYDDLLKQEIARQKAENEKAAATEWATLQNSENLTSLKNFIAKYGDTPSAKLAQQRYDKVKIMSDAIKEYDDLAKDLDKYRKWRSSNITKVVIVDVVCVGAIVGGIYCLSQKDEKGDMPGWGYAGIPLVSVGFGAGLGYSINTNTYSKQINRTKQRMNELRPKMQLSFQPQVMQINPYSKDLAYGVGIRFTF